MLKTICFLIISNVFMTFAWYGHLKYLKNYSLWMVILLSWLIALFEYLFQVPANRIGINYFSLPQLKVIQEVITMIVFAFFSVLYMKVPLTKNFLLAGIFLVLAVFFIFKDLAKY